MLILTRCKGSGKSLSLFTSEGLSGKLLQQFSQSGGSQVGKMPAATLATWIRQAMVGLTLSSEDKDVNRAWESRHLQPGGLGQAGASGTDPITKCPSPLHL